MNEERDIDQDRRDVLDNPEWSAEDLRSGKTLADFAPALAANIRRDLRRPEGQSIPPQKPRRTTKTTRR